MADKRAAWIDANEATSLLGVSRATLYAYVSRGRIRSESAPGAVRRSRYSRDDVERLRARTRERRNPERAAEQALHWGLPILESSITLIGDGRIYYRGRDAAELARTSSLADVAALIWTGKADAAQLGAPPRVTVPSGARSGADVPFVARAQAALALAAPADPLAYDLRPHSVARAGWRILHLLAHVAAGPSSEPTIDAALAAAWRVSRHVDLIRATPPQAPHRSSAR